MNNIWEAMDNQGSMMGFISSKHSEPSPPIDEPEVTTLADIAKVSNISGRIAASDCIHTQAVIEEMPSQSVDAWHGIED